MSIKILVKHTSIEIYDYELHDCEKLEKMLSLWDPNRYTVDPVGYRYNPETKTLTVPRGVDVSYLERLFDCMAEYSYTPDPYDNISLIVKTPPRDDAQKVAISYLIGENDFMYTRKYSQLLLNLEPGAGKTYIATTALAFYKMTTIVITHEKKIKKQWIDTLLNMTDVDESMYFDIRAQRSIEQLMMSNNLKYKVYFVNHMTLAKYAKNIGWDGVHRLFEHLKIGVKIIDEAHLCFRNMINIDLHTNCKKNIYLTATFERSDRFEERLFKICTRNIINYNIESKFVVNDKRQIDKKRKHICHLGFLFNSKPPLDVQGSMSTMRGFNGIRYSQYLSTCQTFFDGLKYLMDYFNNKEGKVLILTAKIECCDIIAQFIKDNYPNKKVSQYHSKIDDNDKANAFDADVICSTYRSSGTGADIPRLRVVINTEAYSSKVIAEQVSGRLREYDENTNTFYVEMIDIGFKKAYDMYQRRLPILKKKCLKILKLEYKGE